MKNNILYLFCTGLFLTVGIGVNRVCATDYVSAGSGNWTTTTTWTPNGNPVAGDNVTILSGHTVSTTSNVTCDNFTINLGGTLSKGNSVSLTIRGNFINNGTYAGGAGNTIFSTNAKTVSGTGAVTAASLWFFGVATTITAGTVISKPGGFSAGSTVTNQGDVTSTDNTITGAGTWTNDAGSALTVNLNLTMTGTFNASASNTVTYAGASYTISKLPSASTFYNLVIAGTGNKTLGGAITVSNNLTISSILTAPASGNINIAGAWTNNGSFTHNNGTVTFNGAGGTIGGTSSTGFYNLTITGTLTGPAGGNIIVLNNWTNNGTFTHNSGTVSFNGTVGAIGGSVTTDFYNLTIRSTCTLTGPAGGNINIANTWTNNGAFTHNSGTVTFTGAGNTIAGAATTNFYNITITGTLTGPAGGNINLAGAWTNNGTFTHNNGTVTYNGSAAQTIGGTATTDFYNITQSNSAGVSLTANQNLINILTISLGTFTSTGYNFTLKSTSTNTARIATIPSGADFSGNIIIERYAAGPTQWRNFGSPVSGATIAQWADDFATSGFTGAICGPADCALPGCTLTCNWPSIYYYNEPTPGTYDLGYVAATNVTNSLVLGRGYFVYLGPNPVTFEVSGPPYKFAQSLPVSGTGSFPSDDDGWNLVCNVVPCAQDWDAPSGWTKTNLDDAIYVYNSNGAYASYVFGVGTNGGSQYIASQQGFWVKANAAGPALAVNENVKASGENPSFLKQAPSPNTSRAEPAFRDFYVPPFTNNLPNSILFTANGNGGKEDEIFIQFLAGASANFDSQYDAYDLENDTYLGVPNMASLSADNKDLSINRMPDLTGNVSIPIRLRVSVADTYSLRRDSILMLPSSWCISLEDLATGNFVDLKQNISYSFYISDTTLAPRFILHLNNPIAVHQTFSASCFASNDGMAISQGALGGPWTYIWKDSLGNIVQTTVSNSADTLFASQGVYILEISSASCGMVNDTFVITAPPLLALSALFNNVSCNGFSDGSAAVVAAGGSPPFYYLWNTGDTTSVITNLPIGNYSVTVTDANGCTNSAAGLIDEPVHSIFTVSSDTLYVNFNDTAYFTNSSTGATFYEWNFGDGSPLDNSFAPSHFYSNAGTYTITLVSYDNTPCYDTSYSTVVVLNTTPVTSTSTSTSLTVLYDENGEVFLQFNLEQTARVNILIYNVLGEKIAEQNNLQIRNEKIKLPLTNVSKGMYLAVATTEGQVIARKIIK